MLEWHNLECRIFDWRKLACGTLIFAVPAFLNSQTADLPLGGGRAMLHSDGGTSLNGAAAPDTSALFPNDLVQTQAGHTAKIDAAGSSVVVREETVVQYDGDELFLDHGSLQLSTASALRVRVDCITVIPMTSDRTQYDVTDVDGKVKVAAFTNDVKIHQKGGAAHGRKADSGDVIVHQGEQATRSDKCGVAEKPADTAAANGPVLNNPWVIGAAIVGVGVITCLGLCHSDDPASPSKP